MQFPWRSTTSRVKAKERTSLRFAMFAKRLVIFLGAVGTNQRVKIHLRPVKAQKVKVVRGPGVLTKGPRALEKEKARKEGKPGKQYAMDGPNEESWGNGGPEAENQDESWNDENWPADDQQVETGEQGALCVVSAVSARQPPKQRPFTKSEKHLAGEQEQCMKGKIWKRPQQFWTMPYRLVCNQSCCDGKFYCGFQRCKSKGFDTPNKFMQHPYSKVGEDGHPRRQQLEAWNQDPYVPPKGFPPYGPWDSYECTIRKEPKQAGSESEDDERPPLREGRVQCS